MLSQLVKGLVNGRPFGIVSVTEFGAKGDGTNDDTSALQNAIDAASGKVLVLPPGTYRTTAPLTWSARLTLIAFGATISADHAGPVINFGNALYPIIIGLTINGNSRASHGILGKAAGQTAIMHSVIYGVAVGVEFSQWYDNIYFLGCRIAGSSNGFKFSLCNTGVIQNCFLYGGGKHVYMESCEGIQIKNTSMQAASAGAIELRICHQILIEGCWLEGNGTGATELLVSGPDVNGRSAEIVVHSCHIGNTSAGAKGIHLEYARNCIVSNVIFDVPNGTALLNDGPDKAFANVWQGLFVKSGSVVNLENYRASGQDIISLGAGSGDPLNFREGSVWVDTNVPSGQPFKIGFAIGGARYHVNTVETKP